MVLGVEVFLVEERKLECGKRKNPVRLFLKSRISNKNMNDFFLKVYMCIGIQMMIPWQLA